MSAPWFAASPELYEHEAATVAAEYPTLSMSIEDSKAVIKGVFRFTDESLTDDGFHIRIVLPEDYPRNMPEMFLIGDRVPRIMNRHLNFDGSACLCVAEEKRRFFPPGSSIIQFMRDLVYPYLLGQVYYEMNGRWPPWGERAHGIDGAREWYCEELRIENVDAVLCFIEMLAERRSVKGHHPCPCASGRRFKNCHSQKYKELKGLITPAEAGKRLEEMRQETRS